MEKQNMQASDQPPPYPVYPEGPPQPQGYGQVPPVQYANTSVPPQGYPQQTQPYAPQNQGYSQPPYGQATTVQYVTNVQALPQFGQIPVNMNCPHCHAQIITGISFRSGLLPWLICGGLILVGCWIGCCLVPFCIDGCKDVTHSCPNCNHKVGEFRRI